MTDLKNKDDIILLVNSFYEKVKENELLGPIFNHIAHVDWEQHLPKMYSFWDFILFGSQDYQGHPLRPHLALNAIHPIGNEHFKEWLRLFEKTVLELYEGEKASEIIQRAKGIGETWSYKIDYLNKLNASE